MPATIGTLLLAVACGSASEQQARSAVGEFLRALGEGRAQAACALLSEQARGDLESAASRPCADALLSVGLPVDPVTAIELWGSEAQARTPADTVFLHEYGDGWRVTGAGCTPQGGDAPYDCEVGGP
ncbi:hypothetical protein ACFS2C_06500 [Prauserella oleivorans]|uniref:Lipoprotein n=1 Tax=Prauserella oleivorans TaxID=1478153 RepID=A0ABW5W574_9PSEU